MDLQPTHQQEATSSSSSSIAQQQQSLDQTSSSTTTVDSKVLRTSARVKAAKQKSKTRGKGKEQQSTHPDQETPSSAVPTDNVTHRITRVTTNPTKSKRSRETTSGKGKAKEVSEENLPRASKRSVYTPISYSDVRLITSDLKQIPP